MRISVFGLGYIGCVNLACLAKIGHNVIGVDINPYKVELINKGIATIVERDIDQMVKSAFDKKIISATTDYLEAVAQSDLSFVCVGTPGDERGYLNFTHLFKVVKDIAKGIALKDSFHVVVIQSTVSPGITEKITKCIIEISQKQDNHDFCILLNPEFLREGEAVEDYFNPGIIVMSGKCAKGIKLLTQLYKDLNGTVEIVETGVAESIKLLNNTWHALKVAFINEIGAIGKAINVNTGQLVDIFLKDKKLNISSAYLRLGFAYGGSCLSKDLKALKLISHDNCQDTPIINSIEESNRSQILRAIKLIESSGKKKIGIWGITFKQGTDDLRNSPIIEIIEVLIEKGYKVYMYDNNVDTSLLFGINKEYINKKLPYFKSLVLNNFNTLLQHIEMLIVNTKGSPKDYKMIQKEDSISILDLKNIKELKSHPHYNGFNW